MNSVKGGGEVERCQGGPVARLGLVNACADPMHDDIQSCGS